MNKMRHILLQEVQKDRRKHKGCLQDQEYQDIPKISNNKEPLIMNQFQKIKLRAGQNKMQSIVIWASVKEKIFRVFLRQEINRDSRQVGPSTKINPLPEQITAKIVRFKD